MVLSRMSHVARYAAADVSKMTSKTFQGPSRPWWPRFEAIDQGVGRCTADYPLGGCTALRVPSRQRIAPCCPLAPLYRLREFLICHYEVSHRNASKELAYDHCCQTSESQQEKRTHRHRRRVLFLSKAGSRSPMATRIWSIAWGKASGLRWERMAVDR
jgi:hypothetical protein